KLMKIILPKNISFFAPISKITMKTRKAIKITIATVFVTWLAHLQVPAEASVVIGGTRVIYNSSEADVTVKLSNEGKSPALVQSWVDAGEVKGAPSDIKVPFTVTPPISRIDPSKSQTLRIIYTGERLPTDRESVFWLNVLEVPPVPRAADADTNRIQLAFRSRIKLFFRPDNLKGSPVDAPSRLVWQLTRADGKPALEVHNPTVYYVSLIGIAVQDGATRITVQNSGMVSPGETRTFALSGDPNDSSNALVHYTALTDFGGAMNGDAPLKREAVTPSN
ncbi:fimbria/pilus periplasmic chaperone, partial [Burkholderia cepacia]|uniref:fimbria/pilus periplasmic chaperone n=1 Tax=Burkholderia cepacia TaxID=292 RepID=UPI002ABE168B